MQNIREMFSNLQAGLKKRQQLSGQIIEIASGYMAHEQLTQLKVAQNNTGQMQMVAQAFPQLKADATYQKLMQQLETLENDILARRENYNNRVNAYNSYRNSFPVGLVAQKLSFNIIQYFDTDDEKFDLQAQSFSRDDTQALQQFIDGSAKAVGDMTSQAVKHINQGVSQLKDKLDSAKPEQPNGDEPQDKEKQTIGSLKTEFQAALIINMRLYAPQKKPAQRFRRTVPLQQPNQRKKQPENDFPVFRLPFYAPAYATPTALSNSSAAKMPSALPAKGLSPVSRRRSLCTLPSMPVLLFFTTMPSSSKRFASSQGSLPGI